MVRLADFVVKYNIQYVRKLNTTANNIFFHCKALIPVVIVSVLDNKNSENNLLNTDSNKN